MASRRPVIIAAVQTVTVRKARRDDCQSINDILNHYVANSTATFLTEPQTLDERLAWFDGRGSQHPVVVAEAATRVVGWASLSTFRTRAAYSRTAEVGVYVHHDFHRRGIGRALIDDVVARGHVRLRGRSCAGADRARCGAVAAVHAAGNAEEL